MPITQFMKTLMGKILSVRNLHSSPVCGAVLLAAVAALSMVCPAAFSAEPVAPKPPARSSPPTPTGRQIKGRKEIPAATFPTRKAVSTTVNGVC
jgi:hypothetical protein